MSSSNMSGLCVTLVLTLLVVNVPRVLSFNLEPKLPTVKFGEQGSYFGYSVAAHIVFDKSDRNNRIIGKQSRVIVGAPQSSSNISTRASGNVFSCGIFRQAQCEPLNFDGLMVGMNRDDMWLGVAVASGAEKGIMVCSHRGVSYEKADGQNTGTPLSFGACFSFTGELQADKIFAHCDGKPTNGYHEDFGLCQAGTSAHVSKDYTLYTMGAPGARTWRGAVHSYMEQPGSITKGWFETPTDKRSSPVDTYAYLGMSVTTGTYFDKNTPTWVSGAPRANETGAVLFFRSPKAQHSTMLELMFTLVGEQIASSFGYTIATVDIDNDGWDDIIVGAPFYYKRGIGGAVYVYLNSPGRLNAATKFVKLTGNKEESRFGFALTSLGDINKDGYNDFAVGAPYEDDGAVYVYLGSSEGVKTIRDQNEVSIPPSQIIRPQNVRLLRSGRDIGRKLRTFGYSLSGGVDLDHNGYPDLAIGNYASDSVVIIRARPILDISSEVTGLKRIDPTSYKCSSPTSICFSFIVCFSMPTNQRNVAKQIEVLQRIEAETFTGKARSRVAFADFMRTSTPHISERRLSSQGRQCTTENLYLVDSVSDIQNKIQFKLTYSTTYNLDDVQDHDIDLPLDKYPILNQEGATKEFKVDFLKNCGSNDICESAIRTKVSFNLSSEKGMLVYYLGSDQIKVDVSVVNSGEPAFDAFLYVSHPEEVDFVGFDKDKQRVIECRSELKEALVKCSLGNPYDNDERINLVLKFSPRSGADALSRMTFIIWANTTSQDTELQPPITTDINIIRAAELDIQGTARPEQVWYGGKVVGASEIKDESGIGSEVVHTYKVLNYGPYMVPDFNVLINWPLEAENHRKNGKYLLYITDLPKVSINNKDVGSCRPMSDNIVNPLGFSKYAPLTATTAPLVAASRTRPTKAPERSTRPIPVHRETTTTTTAQPTTPDYSDYEYGDYEEPKTSTVGNVYNSRTKTTYIETIRRNTSYSSSRTKRDVIVAAESIRMEGRTWDVVTMRCTNTQTARCVKFMCTVNNLQKHNTAIITIKARLWNATFVEDYPRVDLVSIISSAEIKLDSEVDIRQNTTNDYAEAETKAYPDSSLYQRSDGVPWWVIAIGVIIGILLLVAIIYFLKKTGFFERNRPRDGYAPAPTSEKEFSGTQFAEYGRNF